MRRFISLAALAAVLTINHPASIEYGHALTDTGPEWVQETIAARGGEAGHD